MAGGGVHMYEKFCFKHTVDVATDYLVDLDDLQAYSISGSRATSGPDAKSEWPSIH